MNFAIYGIGALLVIGAVCYGALALGLAAVWVAVIGVALVGIALMAAVRKTDPGHEKSSHARR